MFLNWVAALGRAMLEADRLATHALLATAPLPLAVFRADNHEVVVASDAWRALQGGGIEPAPSLLEALERADKTQTVVTVSKLRFRAKPDAINRACSIVVLPVKLAPDVRGLIATAEDSTDDVLAEELETPPGALIWSGVNDVADYWNARWQTYTACRVDDGTCEWRRYLFPEDLAHYEQAMHDTVAKKTVQVEARLLRGDGHYRWHQLKIIREDGGRWFAVGADIEDTQHAQKQRIALLDRLLVALNEAESANRAKDNFLATVSHELRAPVTTIMLWEKVLRDHLDDPKLRIRALDAIRDSATAQSRLVGDLLDISRAISGKLRLERKRILIEGVLSAAVEAALPSANAKQIHIELTCKPRLGKVMADQARLRQVFDNLLSNAVKFTPPGGRIAVTAQRERGSIKVTVTDTGRGIEEHFLQRLFTPFVQDQEILTRSEGGLGLGLAITKQLVGLHDGTLSAESPGRDKGATFTVTLPSASHRHSTPVPTTPEPAAKRLDRVRVLVIDDEPRVREALKLLLTRTGATVEAAASAEEARTLIARERPDVLICDISMPNEDGYTFLRTLRSSGGTAQNVPAIALTAYASERDRTRASAAGFDAHLAKPIQLPALAAAINHVLHDGRESQIT